MTGVQTCALPIWSRRRARREFVLELPASRTARQLYLLAGRVWGGVELANKKPQWPREVSPGDPPLSARHSLNSFANNSKQSVQGRFSKPQLTLVNCAQVSSVTQSCLTLCDPMDCSTPAHPAHHQLPEPTQTHVHPVGDAIQPSHPLSSPSPPAFNLSQHQGLFQGVSSSHQVAKVLEFQLQHQSFQ